MNTTHNTILVTGGSAGIGYAIARLFSAQGNHVIITGRDENRLKEAASKLSNVTAIRCDVTIEEDIEELSRKLYNDFPGLNMVINNAGRAYIYKLEAGADAFDKASKEMLTNYLSVIRLNEKLMPLLRRQSEAAIVNVSSIVAFAPNHILAGYGASKAALHSYTQSLRYTLQQDTDIRVFELMPPLVNTEFSQAIGGSRGIAPEAVAEDLLRAVEQDNYEIHVGQTAAFYELALSSPQEAFFSMNAAK